jgi:uncharacterized protein
MTKNNRDITLHILQKILVVLLIILMIIFQYVDFHFFAEAQDAEMAVNSISRFLGGLVFVIVIIGFGYRWIFKSSNIWKSMIIIIPALIISINNFPIIAFFDGRAVLTEPTYRVFLFLIECLSVGFFEEIIFRGILLVFLINKLSEVKHGVLLAILISSALFGLSHVFNILNGAGIGDTLMQIGYSFLVGMMWSVMFLRTGNIWLTMLLHATFNFFGQVMFNLGTVDGRYDIYTVVITILFVVMVAFYSMMLYQQFEKRPLIHATKFDNE